MEEIRYAHAADLHLDAPFRGVSRDISPRIGEALRKAAFDALDNLVALCERERPDFLLLAGDIYNAEERGIHASLKMLEACRRLDAIHIPVLIAQGNHDPLSSRLPAIAWPENVTIFGAEPATRLLARNGEPLVIAHGASHAEGGETRNLAKMFKRDSGHNCFQIGLLHCDAGGAVKDFPYAPCSMRDLLDAGLDAWALGHAHTRQVLSREPFIAYSGNTQGLDANETGARGCFMVTARHVGSRWVCEEKFVELGPIRWENLEINVDGVASLDAALDKAQEAVEDLIGQLPQAKAIIGSMVMTGRSELDRNLRSEDFAAHLAEACSSLGNAETAFWLRKLDVATMPAISEEDALDRDDLLGEVARLARDFEGDGQKLEEFMEKALKPLFGARRYTGALPQFDPAALRSLLRGASRICQDGLEAR